MEIKPPKCVYYLWVVRSLAAACLIFVLLSFLDTPFSYSAFLLWGLFAFAYLPVFLRGYKIILGKNKIEIVSGVFVRQKRVYNSENIIYISKITLPDGAVFDVCTVEIRGVRVRCITAEVEMQAAEKMVKEICIE